MVYWTNKLANKAPSTRERYIGFFEQFRDFAKMTPEELINQKLLNSKAEDPREKKAVECLLTAWMIELRNKKYSPATQQIAFAAVKSFFASNEFPLNISKNEIPKSDREREDYQVRAGSRAITREMIRQILESKDLVRNKTRCQVSLQTKALIMLLKDTGLRVSDVRNLNYGVVAEGLEKNYEFIPLILKTQKAGIVAYTFMGSESINAYKAYLKERKDGSRHLEPETITSTSPLFRTHEGKAVKRMTRSGLSNLILSTCQRTLKDEKKLSAHSFRKFLQTTLESRGVHANWIDKILGHELRGSTGAYSKPEDFAEKDRNVLFESYKNAYPMLRIFPERVETETRVSNLETELANRNKEIAELKSIGHQKASELESLGARFTKMEEAFKAKTLEEKIAVGQAEDADGRQNEFINKLMITVKKLAENQGLALEDVPFGDGDSTPERWKKAQTKKKLSEAK